MPTKNKTKKIITKLKIIRLQSKIMIYLKKYSIVHVTSEI